ncbi:hypothetical protein CR513_28939, partial [Mucuna pruriens]
MEFSDNLLQFNIFEAMKHTTEDHSLFGIDIINELVAEYLQLAADSAEFPNFVEDIDEIGCLRSAIDEFDYDNLWEVQDLFDSEDDDIDDLAQLNLNSELIDLIDQVCKYDGEPECSKRAEVHVSETKKPLQVQVTIIFLPTENYSDSEGQKQAKANSISDNKIGADSNSAKLSRKQPKAEIKSTHLVSTLNQVGQPDLKLTDDISPSSSPPTEVKQLPSHLKSRRRNRYRSLGNIRQTIGWKLSNLLSINLSICIHRILMEEEARPIRQQ